MSQQIINIPVNWDDDLFNNVINKAVINEVKTKMEKEAMNRLGLDRTYGYNSLFEDIVKECMRELLNENKDEIIKNVSDRAYRSLIQSKDFKEAKKEVKGQVHHGSY